MAEQHSTLTSLERERVREIDRERERSLIHWWTFLDCFVCRQHFSLLSLSLSLSFSLTHFSSFTIISSSMQKRYSERETSSKLFFLHPFPLFSVPLLFSLYLYLTICETGFNETYFNQEDFIEKRGSEWVCCWWGGTGLWQKIPTLCSSWERDLKETCLDVRTVIRTTGYVTLIVKKFFCWICWKQVFQFLNCLVEKCRLFQRKMKDFDIFIKKSSQLPQKETTIHWMTCCLGICWNERRRSSYERV